MGPDASIQKLPSNIRSLDLTDKNLTFIPITFSKKSKLTTFILSKNNIHELPKNLKNLKTLVMSFNNITEINSDMLDGLLSYPCIESLDFSYNLLQCFPSQALNIKTLKTLTLFGNQITSLNCSSESQLTFLDLGRNELKSVPNIPESLQTLILDCNMIKNINKINNPSKITKLCVSRNQLESFNPYSAFPLLTTLDISDNKLSSLPNFSKIAPHLRKLDASNNFINELPQFPRTLSEIIMRNNRLTGLNSNFTSLPCLVFADLSQNLIDELPVLPRVLQTFIIYDNNIKTIQPTVAMEMFRLYLMNNELEEIPLFKSNALVEYYLSSNKIKNINCKNLSKVANRLDISNNLVEELPVDLFIVPKAQNGVKITHIFAYHNQIKKLPTEFLSSEIIALNLSQNPIQELPEILPATLEQLYINKCNLKSLPPPDKENDDIIELISPNNQISEIPFYSKLVTLNLSNNLFKKLPKLPETLQFLDISGNMIDNLDSLIDNDVIITPHLEYLDVSFNKLTNWPDNLNLPSLQTLKLRGNENLKANFSEISTFLPSITFLDATETCLEFTDESLAPLKQVLLSENVQILRVKKPKNKPKIEEEKTEEETEKKKSDSDDENAQKNNDKEEEEEERRNNKEKSSEKLEEEEEDDREGDVYLNTFPVNVSPIPKTVRIAYSTFRHEREVNEDIVMFHRCQKMAKEGENDGKKGQIEIEIEEEENESEEKATKSETETEKNAENNEKDKINNETIFAAIFDSRSSGKVASAGSCALKKLINSRSIEFTSDFFSEVCNSIGEVLHNKSIFDGSSIAITMVNNRDIYYTTVGDMKIIISNGQKDGFRFIQKDIESGRNCGNKTFGQLSISKIVGDYLVYGTDISPEVNSLSLNDDDRFVVMICAAVYEMLSYDQFGEIFSVCENANEIASAIKSTTIGNMSSDNISVVVIDVST